MKHRWYKGRLVLPAPYQLAESLEWKVKVQILEETEGSARVTPYTASNTYKTEKGATAHCYNFAKQIIDGQIVPKKPRPPKRS